MRCSRTEAPSLHRRYPASPVLRASPPPCSARPDPRGLSVGACHATGRASRVASIPLVHTCRRHYPGGTGRCSRRSLPDRWQPSPYSGRVGFRITRFEACAAFTSLRPAWSLNRPGRPLSSECFSRCRYLHRPLRLLPAGATVAGRDSHPLRNGAFHGAPECPVIGPKPSPRRGRRPDRVAGGPGTRAAELTRAAAELDRAVSAAADSDVSGDSDRTDATLEPGDE